MKPSELRTKTQAELTTLLVDTRRELTTYERSLAAGELPNPQVVGKTRRDIARLLTVLNTPVKAPVERTEKGDA